MINRESLAHNQTILQVTYYEEYFRNKVLQRLINNISFQEKQTICIEFIALLTLFFFLKFTTTGLLNYSHAEDPTNMFTVGSNLRNLDPAFTCTL